MVVVNYLLFESAVGFSLFEVVHQADTVGLELPEVKDAMKSLDKFGKMVQLRSFNPWTYVLGTVAAGFARCAFVAIWMHVAHEY